MKKKIYIAGKVSGENERATEYKFFKKECSLADSGHEVVNPVYEIAKVNVRRELLGEFQLREPADRKKILAMCIKWLCECNAIYMLAGWKKSAGAVMEHHIAQTLGMEIMYE
jgi:hypothetical protein